MMQPDELGRQAKLFVANWLMTYPEDADLPEDVVRRVATQRVLARERQGKPPLFATGRPEIPDVFLNAWGPE